MFTRSPTPLHGVEFERIVQHPLRAASSAAGVHSSQSSSPGSSSLKVLEQAL